MAASYLEYFNASKGAPLNRQIGVINLNAQILTIDGVKLDVICKTVPLQTGEEKRRRVLEQIDPQSMGSHPIGKPHLQAFFETMVFDNATLHGGNTLKDPIGDQSLIRLAVGFLHELDAFNHETRCHRHMKRADSERPGIHQSEVLKLAVEEYRRLEATDPEELHWRREEYRLRTEEATNGNLTSIFSTETNYVCRGLISIREGDIIANLFGCRLPVVLRESTQPSTYQLISPCYVSGIMDGEAIETLKLGSFPRGNVSYRMGARQTRMHLV